VSELLTKILAWLNAGASPVGRTVLGFVGTMPGWLSNSIISLVAGVGMLLIFKHTSNQAAIGRARDGIKADLLSLRLFKDSITVTFGAQGRMIKGAGLLFVHAMVPLAVMLVPIMLLLGQMGVWYQFKPLAVGEEVVVALKVAPAVGLDAQMPDIQLQPNDAVEIAVGPMASAGAGEVWWTLRALKPGTHTLTFLVDGESVTKTLTVGDHPMRVSKLRPGMHFTDVLLHPDERPFRADDTVEWIDVQYAESVSLTAGADNWVIYFFIASIVFALLFKGMLGVRI
jgi:hypothetical protein